MSTSLKWINASERLPDRKFNFHVRMSDGKDPNYLFNNTCYFDGEQFQIEELYKRSWRVVEWLEEKEIELPDWKEALEKEAKKKLFGPANHQATSHNDLLFDFFKSGAEWAKQVRSSSGNSFELLKQIEAVLNGNYGYLYKLEEISRMIRMYQLNSEQVRSSVGNSLEEGWKFEYRSMGEDYNVILGGKNFQQALIRFAKCYHEIEELYSVKKIEDDARI